MPFDEDFILKFYESHFGIYIIQGSVHSLISVIIVNSIIRSLDIKSPSIIQGLHFIPIVIPPIALPGYYLISLLRKYQEGKLALLDLERILAIDYKGINVGMLILLLFSITTILFIIQESIPVIKNILSSKKEFEQKRILRTLYRDLY